MARTSSPARAARTVGEQIAARHFSRTTLAALRRKGVTVYGITAVPGPSGTYLDSETYYQINDNGCGCIRSFREVLEMAGQ